MRPVRAAIAAGALLMLAACATSPDPKEGGFFSGVSGLISGGYEQRIADQSAELQNMQQQQAKAEAEAREADAALQEREQALVTLRKDIAALDRTLKDAKSKAARLTASNATLSTGNRQLMGDLDNASKRLAGLKEQLQPGATGADYEAERKKFLDLQTTIEALTEQLNGSRN